MKDLNLPSDVEAQIVTAIRLRKPHLIEIEQWVQDVHDGYLEIKIDVRAGRVEKMTRFSGKYWIREKEVDINST